MPEPAAIDSSPCPACRGRLFPRVLQCADCGLEVTTRYAHNEFAQLEPEQLHLLRIFVLCEGRITDMETALGVSYPTVKSRLLALRTRLGLDDQGKRVAPEPVAADRSGLDAQPGSVSRSAAARDILSALERGAIDYDEALRRIKALPG